MKKLIYTLRLAFILCLSIPLGLMAQEKFGLDKLSGLPQGISLNSKAPLFSEVDIHGDLIDFAEVLKDKSIVLLFYRGEWCPVCNNYLRNLNDSLQLIEDHNAIVIAVGPEKTEYALATEKKVGADFRLISDVSQKIMKAYDVLFRVSDDYQQKIQNYLNANIAAQNGMDEAWLPVPATFIINQEGMIVYKQFDYDYTNRADVSEIVRHLNE